MEKIKRPCMIVGNWKMHKMIEEAIVFVMELKDKWKETENIVGLAVPYTLIYPLSLEVLGSPILIGAQNMNDAVSGAFTGEIAGSMIQDAGASFVLLGHSERRHLFHEDNAFINHKVKRAVEIGLHPILCIGESKVEFENNQTKEVLERQLVEGLKGLSGEQLGNLTVAYEPVWAIGNGHSATPEVAQEMHMFCRQVLAQLFNEEFAQKTIIQYGGSVNPLNAHELLAQPDIDGLLIGGASLSLETFLQIVNDRY